MKPKMRKTLAWAVALTVPIAVLVVAWIWHWALWSPNTDVPPPVVSKLERHEESSSARVLFLGDFAPTDAAMPYIEKRGYGYPFDATRALLGSYDAVVANLEAPITTSDRKWPVPKKYVYKVHPDAVSEIKRAGIDAVTLANNHIHDYGRRGVEDTLKHLDRAGILRAGAGLSEADARRGLVLDTPGGRVGILPYMQSKLKWSARDLSFALDTPFRSWAGAARLSRENLASDLSRLRSFADVVVVVPHWGENYETVDRNQTALGRMCIDLGADAVIGHHPHWYQPVELYRDKPLVYSLGNYAFGTRGRRIMRYGMGVALEVENKKVVGLEIIPLETQNRIVKYRPRVPTGKRLNRFFKDLIKKSEKLGASIERRGDRGWLSLQESVK